jgi:hypothetical protein
MPLPSRASLNENADLLVKLENLPSENRVPSVVIRRAMPDEITKLKNWVASYFDTYWAKEVAIGFNNNPISIYVAAQNGTIVGSLPMNARQKDSSVTWA